VSFRAQNNESTLFTPPRPPQHRSHHTPHTTHVHTPMANTVISFRDRSQAHHTELSTCTTPLQLLTSSHSNTTRENAKARACLTMHRTFVMHLNSKCRVTSIYLYSPRYKQAAMAVCPTNTTLSVFVQQRVTRIYIDVEKAVKMMIVNYTVWSTTNPTSSALSCTCRLPA
jgi:hypothetical protein